MLKLWPGCPAVAGTGSGPWLTIEDPEVGMRLWGRSLRLGVTDRLLVEEALIVFVDGLSRRKRWVCGFLQTLNKPPKAMGMTW